jgi:endonuclease YncB( thermonuclease family)
MRGHYQILLPLLSLFLSRVDLTDLSPLSIKAQILQVFDGDTVLIKARGIRQKLRLSRIDAPELRQPFLSSKGSAGLFAKKCLKTILKYKKEVLVTVEGFDRYGRLLGDIDGSALKLIQNGCVSIYPHAQFSSQKEKFLFLRSLQSAKDDRIGVWKKGGYLSPKVWRKNSNKRNEYQYWRQ